MNVPQPDRARYVCQLLDSSALPRNQIASLSGLSNTYIRDLEQGNIANVGREKLIAFAVALNLSLGRMDEMLTVFGRARLNRGDIDLFLRTAEQRRFSAALLPVHDDFTLGLVMLSTERLPGNHHIVSSEPTVTLRSGGHVRYTQRRLIGSHALYEELVEAIAAARRQALIVNLGRYRVEQYICRHCLEDYILRCRDSQEADWRRDHLQSVVWFLNHYPKWTIFLTDTCPTFIFTLKETAPPKSEDDKLTITRMPPHRFQGRRRGKLAGFTTGSPIVIRNFRLELESIAAVAIDAFRDRNRLVAYLENLARS